MTVTNKFAATMFYGDDFVKVTNLFCSDKLAAARCFYGDDFEFTATMFLRRRFVMVTNLFCSDEFTVMFTIL